MADQKPMYGNYSGVASDQASGGMQAAASGTASAPGGSAWNQEQREWGQAQKENQRYTSNWEGSRGLGGSYGANTAQHEKRKITGYKMPGGQGW